MGYMCFLPMARLIMEAPHLQGYVALNSESWKWLVLLPMARLIMEAPHLQGYAALNIESWKWLMLFNWFVAIVLSNHGITFGMVSWRQN